MGWPRAAVVEFFAPLILKGFLVAFPSMTYSVLKPQPPCP